MSTLRPSSVCDTTPLQRLESQSSATASEPSSPVTDAATAGCVNQAVSVNGAGGLLVKGISTVANHNNNKIAINLNGYVSSTIDTTNTSSNSTTDTGNPKMDSQGVRQFWDRFFWDFILLSCVGLPILLFHMYGVPYKRGFFCNDDTLKHPYRNSSIRTWMLYVGGIIVPIAIMMVVEYLRATSQRIDSFTQLSPERYRIFNREMPVWLLESYKKIVPLLCGVAAGQLTTDVAKYSIGRLRPHFFAVCQPIMPDGTTCDDPIHAGRYIEHFRCRAVGVSAKMLKEVRLSFPSGHSTFALFTMLYIVIYLQVRMPPRFKMFKHLLQLLFLMMAWYTALSRVSDYKHHWTDVLGGSSVGTFYALVVTQTLW